MIRKKYKSLYEWEKAKRETVENRFDTLIEQLKRFDLKVSDKIVEQKYGNYNSREIIIEQDKDHCIEIVINRIENN